MGDLAAGDAPRRDGTAALDHRTRRRPAGGRGSAKQDGAGVQVFDGFHVPPPDSSDRGEVYRDARGLRKRAEDDAEAVEQARNANPLRRRFNGRNVRRSARNRGEIAAGDRGVGGEDD